MRPFDCAQNDRRYTSPENGEYYFLCHPERSRRILEAIFQNYHIYPPHIL